MNLFWNEVIVNGSHMKKRITHRILRGSMVRCAIWYHLVFFTFFKLYKWYQIAQSITYVHKMILIKSFCIKQLCNQLKRFSRAKSPVFQTIKNIIQKKNICLRCTNVYTCIYNERLPPVQNNNFSKCVI